MRRLFSVLAILFMGLLLASCVTSTGYNGRSSESPARKVIAEQASISQINKALVCMRPTLQGKKVANGVWADGTGKTNSVADGATGNFLPGGTTADFVISALQMAGIQVMDLAGSGSESMMRGLLSPGRNASLVNRTAIPDYYLNGSNLSLDFDKTSDLDIQIKGIGPFIHMQRATVALSVKLVQPGTILVKGHGVVKMSVYSTQAGFGGGRLFGSTLATGEVGAGNQQPMQLWTGEFLSVYATAKALGNLPGVPQRCQAMVQKLLPADVVNM